MPPDHRDPLDTALDWLLRLQEHPEDDELHEQLAVWLASDASHPVAYRQARRAWQVSGALQSRALDTQSAAAPAATHLRARRPLRRLSQVASAIAASCLLALLIQTLYPDWRADAHTAKAEHRQLQLPDGSQLTLGAQSAVKLAFDNGRREVQLLRGQAYFEVVTDTGHPFRVSTGELNVTVTGTAFNVDQTHQRVNVAEGSVQVVTRAGSTAHLTPGQGVALNRSGALQPHDQPAAQVAAWRQGQLILRQERLIDVIETLRPYSSALLVLRDAELGEQRITGVFDLSQPQSTLQTIVHLQGGGLRSLGPIRIIERD